MAKKDVTLEVGYNIPRSEERKISKSVGKVQSLQGISSETVRKRFKQPLGRIRGELGEFEKSMAASNARVIAFGASTAVIAGVATALKGAAKAALDVERSLADINVILNATSKGLNKFGQELFAIAKNTGQSFEVVANAAGELARQGLSMEDTLRRTSDALILARLSGMDTVDAVNSLTAAVNSFGKSALNSTEIVNKLANVDAAFAVSSADLAEAIKRVGSSASDAGVTMDQLIAIVTTAQQTTARGGAVIGNSFKTIFTRLQRPAVLDQLTQLGVATKDASGNILPLIGVLQGLAQNFDKLEDTQKSQVAELVGGVFQVNVLKAALSDLSNEYGVFNRAQEISISSTDEAIRRNEKLNQTLSALINRTFVNLQNVGAQVGDVGFGGQAKGLLDTLNSGIPVLGGLENVDLKGNEMGDRLGRGIIKGLGNFFLGGPGMLLGALGIGKLFTTLGKFSVDAFKGITGLNKETQKRKDLEERIKVLLTEDKALLKQVADGNVTAKEAAHNLYLEYKNQERVLNKVSKLSRGAAGQLGGTSMAKGGATTAAGFIPNLSGSAQERLAMLAAGYSPSDVRTASVRKTKVHNGRGGSFSSFVNSKETVRTGTNAEGYKATFVVPPKSSSAYGNYVNNIPNFASNSQMEDMLRRAGSKGGLGSFVFSGSGNPINRLFKEISDSAGGFTARQKKDVVKAWARSKGGRESIRQNAADRSGRKGDQASRLSGALGGRKGNPLLVFSGEKSSIKGELIGGGAAYEVGIPINKTLLNQGLMQAYPNYVDNAISHPRLFDKDLPKGFVTSLKNRVKTSAPDKEGLGQIYGAVLQTITAGFGSSAQFGSKRYDFAKGGKLDDRLAKYYNKKDPRVGKLFPLGAELKGGEYDLGNIFGKMAAEDKLSKADLIGVGGTRKRYAKAGGFFPNFSAKSRAMATERSMGGDPEFRMFPFPHVADKKRQKSFRDVLRDHPEGLGKAMGNSFAAQGIPNFALPGRLGDLFGGAKRGLVDAKDKAFGTFDTKRVGAELDKLEEQSEQSAQAIKKANKALEKYNKALESGSEKDLRDAGATTTAKKGRRNYDTGELDKRSAEFKGLRASAQEGAALEKKNLEAARKKIDANDKVTKSLLEEQEGINKESAKWEKRRSTAFSAAFLLPTVAGPLIETFTEQGSKANKAFTSLTGGISTAATAMSIIPGPAGIAAGALIAIGTGLGTFTNFVAEVGAGLTETREKLQESVQNLQDASSRYFEVASKLDTAIKEGADGTIITRLSNKLQETLSQLEPAQQALLTSSKSLAEKQNRMGEIIDEQARKLKQTEIAEGLAGSINEARGMGVTSFFKGVGNLFGEGGFTAGANDVDAITSKNLGSIGQGIFTNIGPKKMREALASGGLTGGNFVGSLANAGGDANLISMLNTLNSEGLEAIRLNILRITKESERNTKVARENLRVTKMYNTMIAEGTKIQRRAADELLAAQKRLVDNFVFNREMQSDNLFNQIDVHIAKFDALFGAAAQNLNAFEKADITFRKKKLNAEITFQKQITKNQSTFITKASELAAIATGVELSKTSKKVAVARSQPTTDLSMQFTKALKALETTQDVSAFNDDIRKLLEVQGESGQKARTDLRKGFKDFDHQAEKLREQEKLQVTIAQKILEIEQEQARLLRGGGINAILDPKSFNSLRGSLVDSMEDIFRGRGGVHGAAGVDDLQAGSGFLNLIDTLRKQGFDTKRLATNNPGLRSQAIRARQSQNFAMAEDFRTLGQSTGMPSMMTLANQLMSPKLAADQVDNILDPGKAAREQQDAMKALLVQQGETFKSSTERIEAILNKNAVLQSDTFLEVHDAAAELRSAAATLYRIEVLRATDTTADRLAVEAAEQGIKDAQEVLSQTTARGAIDFAKMFGASDWRNEAGAMGEHWFGGRAQQGMMEKFARAGMGLSFGGMGLGVLSSQERDFLTLWQGTFGNDNFRLAMAEAADLVGTDLAALGTSGQKVKNEQFVDKLAELLKQQKLVPENVSHGQLSLYMLKNMFGGKHNMMLQLQRSATIHSNPFAKETIENFGDLSKHVVNRRLNKLTLDSKEEKRAREIKTLNESQKDINVERTMIPLMKAVGEKLESDPDYASNLRGVFNVGKDIFTSAQTQVVAPFVQAIADMSKSPIKVDFARQIIEIRGGDELRTGVEDAAKTGAAAALNPALNDLLGKWKALDTKVNLLKDDDSNSGSTKNSVNAVRQTPSLNDWLD